MSEHYDSRADTLLHSQRVGELLAPVIGELTRRAVLHDRSKVEAPEVAVFDEYTPRLGDLEYGSPEYDACRAEMLRHPGMQHHYAVNSHHPEHYPNGVNGMNLLDLIEALADWKASGERTRNGDMASSLKIQRERFNISDQLAEILQNTARHLGWLPPGDAEADKPIHGLFDVH